MKFYKNEKDGVIFGVCQGLGEYYGIDPMLFRVIAVLMFGTVAPIYLAIAFFAKEKPCEDS
jgi:phage shock protein C